MINYVPDLIQIVKEVTDKVPVTTTYPDTNIVPIVILYESEQVDIYKCSEYNHASSTITIEIFAKDIPTRNKLRNNIDEIMKSLNFELEKKEDIDNNPLYVSKLTYGCEVIKRKDSIQIYNKKY